MTYKEAKNVIKRLGILNRKPSNASDLVVQEALIKAAFALDCMDEVQKLLDVCNDKTSEASKICMQGENPFAQKAEENKDA